MSQNNTPQQDSGTQMKSHDIGSSIDPNVILPTSQKKSTLRAAIQQADGQTQGKKVAPVMVRSFSKDMQNAMERGKNVKDAKHIKNLLKEKNKEQVPAAPPKKEISAISEKNVDIPKQKTDHMPIPTKDLSGAPKKTLTFASNTPAPARPKIDIPKAPKPPYKNTVSIKDQLLATEKKEIKPPVHIEVQRDDEENTKRLTDTQSINSKHAEKEDVVGKTLEQKPVDGKSAPQQQLHIPKMPEVVKNPSAVQDAERPNVSVPPVPKKEVQVESKNLPSVSPIPVPKKALPKEDTSRISQDDKKGDTAAKEVVMPLEKKLSSIPHNDSKPPIKPQHHEEQKVKPASAPHVDPFESVLFGGSTPSSHEKKDEAKTEPAVVPKKPEPSPIPQVPLKKEQSNIIEPKKSDDAEKVDVPVGMEHKVSEKPSLPQITPFAKKEDVQAVIKQEDTKKDSLTQQKEVLQVPKDIEKSVEEKPVKKEEYIPVETHHRIEDHVSSEQLRAFKNDLTRIDQDIALLEAQQRSAASRKNRLLTEKKDFEQKLEEARQVLDQVIEKEEMFESAIHNLEKEELSIVDPKKRHAVEEKRWVQEDLRAEVEKEKWDVQELYAKVQKAIEEKNNELSRAETSYAEFAKRISQLTKERSEKKFKVKLGEVEEKKREIENIQVALLEEKRRLERLHTSLEEDEKKFVAQRQRAEDDEKKAVSFSEKRSFEESRRSAEKAQREIEQKRWETEESLEKVIEKIQRSNEHYTTISKIEDEIREKLSE